jgi:uncharacterized protein with FMN-binding domain
MRAVPAGNKEPRGRRGADRLSQKGFQLQQRHRLIEGSAEIGRGNPMDGAIEVEGNPVHGVEHTQGAAGLTVHGGDGKMPLLMQRKESTGYYGVLGLTTAFSLLAVVTMLPNPAASVQNVLGYRSVCSFAPAATALCGLMAAAACTLRSRLLSRNASSARYRPMIVPIGVAVLLLAAAGIFGIRFEAVRSHFDSVISKTGARGAPLASLPEGTRSATFSEGDVSATVQVSVSSGAIRDIRLTAGRNVAAALAAKIFADVRKSASTSVDAVSGATASSNVLLKAIEMAALGNSR